MYLFSTVFSLKVGSEIHMYIMFRLSSQLSRGMRKSGFWVSELVRHNVAVQSQMIDGFKGLIFLFLIVVGLYYLSILRT